MAKFEKILLEDDFARWRDKFNKAMEQVRLVEEYPDMTGKEDYVLSNDGDSVKWISQEEILRNFGITPGSGNVTSFSDTVVIGNFAITLDAKTGNITSIGSLDLKGDIDLDGDINCKGSITAEKGFVGNITGDVEGNATSANKLSTKRYIDGIPFDGTSNIHHYGTCSTASTTTAKSVTATGFKLYTGARITVTFTHTNTAQLRDITINVNGTGAKKFYIPGTSTQNSSYPTGLTGLFYTGMNAYELVYNGTAYILSGLSQPRYYMPANISIDLNKCIYQGDYMFETSSGISNIPVGDNGWMQVLTQNPPSMSVVKQIWFRYGSVNVNDYETYQRTGTSSGGSWGRWNRYLCDYGDNIMNGSLTVGGNITGNSSLAIYGNITVNGISTFGGNATFQNSISANGNITANGTISGTRVYNAVFNDYAEYFERGEQTQVGDIIALSISKDGKEKYVKATKKSAQLIVGVHSDSYGHIVGGNMENEQDNIENFIPVGMVGRVKTKIIGPIKAGDKVTISDIPGVGEKAKGRQKTIGFAVESNSSPSIKYVRVKLEV